MRPAARYLLFGNRLPGLQLGFATDIYSVDGARYSSFLSLPGATYTRAGAATAETAAGAIVNFAANVPRITDKGVLIEEARTNLLVNSVFANAGGGAPTSWSQNLGTGTSAAAASTRNSGVSAWSQTATAERPTIASPSITFAINSTYQMSMVVEAITGTLQAIDLLRIGTTPAGATITFPVCPANPTGGAAGVVTTGLLVMQVVTVGTGGSSSTWFGIGGNGAATGTIRFSCPQVELGAFPTSYIPTGAAAATRAADAVDAVVGFQPPAVFVQARVNSLTAAGGRPFEIHNGTENERIILRTGFDGTMTAFVVLAGVQTSVGATAVSAVTAGTTFKAAVRRSAAGTWRLFFNGVAIGSESAVLAQPAATLLSVGKRRAGGEALMGTVERFVAFPAIPTDAQLVALTTL